MQCLRLRLAVARAAVAVLLAVAAGCSDAVLDGTVAFERRFSFVEGDPGGWIAGFAGYPRDALEAYYEPVFEVRSLPHEVGAGQGLYVEGTNRSDGLFMFLKREIGELEPATTYDVVVRAALASDVASGCAGGDRAPAEGVTLKVGATTDEPKVEVRGNVHALTADVGRGIEGGRDAVVAGDVANGGPCAPGYRLIERDNRGRPVAVTSDAAGRIWVFVGADLGFEGTAALYFLSIEVSVQKR